MPFYRCPTFCNTGSGCSIPGRDASSKLTCTSCCSLPCPLNHVFFLKCWCRRQVPYSSGYDSCSWVSPDNSVMAIHLLTWNSEPCMDFCSRFCGLLASSPKHHLNEGERWMSSFNLFPLKFTDPSAFGCRCQVFLLCRSFQFLLRSSQESEELPDTCSGQRSAWLLLWLFWVSGSADSCSICQDGCTHLGGDVHYASIMCWCLWN